MTTNDRINTTNKHQHKLHNSKIKASVVLAICPKYRAHLKLLKHLKL